VYTSLLGDIVSLPFSTFEKTLLVEEESNPRRDTDKGHPERIKQEGNSSPPSWANINPNLAGMYRSFWGRP